ncbi:MAG: T9SS type A sorting domain-containing protein [Flavobacteriaceae bacterium]|nr:T9SS type A sorting domain-containing protein [Flavobacteriaceae bacterium]
MQIRPILIIVLTLLLFTINSNATTYYISTTGNDSNSGTTPASSWKTINKVNTFSLSVGDSVLFKRNDIWRGQLIPQSGIFGTSNYYGAYSSGDNPTILGSLNFSNLSDWTNTGGNVWKCNATFSTDIGNIIFNNATSVGFKKWNLIDLQSQNDFWFNLSSNELLIYSTSNPGNIYTEIELALRKDIINQQNKNFITFENLSIKYGAAHGFGGGNTSNIIINSCNISFIGGGDLDMDGTIRYGNGVEFWGNASNNTVSKCKIWEIYDTGVTNQNHTNTVTQHNIKYQNNLIWNCGLSSFEFWCKPETSITSDIYFENNTCLFAGGGWGIQRPDYHGIHVLISSNTSQTDTVYIKNNIFFEAQRTIYAFEDNANGQYELDYNVIYQPTANDILFAFFPSNQIYTYSNSSTYTNTVNKDVNSVFGNPNFTNLSVLDFSLLNTSIAIDAGTNTNIIDDFEYNSRPYNKIFDIGAYEYSEPLGITDNEYSKIIIVYPNPTNQSFRVRFDDKNKCKLHLYNTNGQRIMAIENYSNNQEIKINNLKEGIYTFTISDSKIIATGKVLIQK